MTVEKFSLQCFPRPHTFYDNLNKALNTKFLNNDMAQPILPNGVSSFENLVRFKNPNGDPYLFVDKSLFIKDFLESGDEITLITRPRRFGKTINLSMIEAFCAKEINGISTKDLFDNLKISKYPNIMALQGSTPVIFITFKEIRGKNFVEAFDLIKALIRKLYDSHLYILKEKNISQHNIELFNKFLTESATSAQYKESLSFLTSMIHKATNKKVILLLDEYDTPLNDAFTNEYLDDMRNFMTGLFNTSFKGNNFLKKALITGILKIAKSSLFSELNNVKVYTCLSSSKYSQYFGFTEEETNSYLDRAGLPPITHELKEMYNGYQIEQYVLYNPFSIVNFIDETIATEDSKKSLKPYWINTGGHMLIRYLVAANIESLQEDLTKLINNKPIKSEIDEDIIMGNQLRHQKIGFWSLLLMAGYLKSIKCERDEMNYKIHTLLFPNMEILESMRKIISETVSAPIGFGNFRNLMQALLEGNIEPFEQFLQEYLLNIPSYFDTGGKLQEQFYHGLLLGISASLYNIYNISSNRESGLGRYDIALEPKDKKRKGIIIELKSSIKKNQELKEVAEEAYQQIITNKYNQEMASRGIKDIIPIGIAFNGKEVKVIY